MKKLIYISFTLLTACFIFSCSKHDELWNSVIKDNPNKGKIIGQLINDDDNTALKGVKILFQRQTKEDGGKSFIDTLNTDADGKFSYEIPYPNKVTVSIRDTGRYQNDFEVVEVLEKKDYDISLKSHPRFGTTSIETVLLDDKNKPFPGKKIVLSVREVVTEQYSVVDTIITDAQGKVKFENIAFPVNFKVAFVENPLAYVLDSIESKLITKDMVSLTLKTIAKFGQDDFVVKSLGFYTLKPIQNETVNVEFKSILSNSFSAPKSYTLNASGNLVLDDIIYPATVRVSSLPTAAVPFETVEFSLEENNLITQQSFSIRETSRPRYASPIYTNLVVEELNTGNVTFSFPQDATFDPITGNTYITDGASGTGYKIVKIDRLGNASILLGGTNAFADGDLSVAKSTGIWGIVADNKGNLYFADNNSTSGNRIRKVTFNSTGGGVVSTIAGSGATGTLDAIGTAATFNRPSGLAIDKNNKYLYVGEFAGNRVRRIDLANNQVTTVGVQGTQVSNGIALSPDETKLFVGYNASPFGFYNLSNNTFSQYVNGTNHYSRGLDIAPNGDLFIYNISEQKLYKTNVNQTPGSAVMTVIAGKGGAARVNGPALTAQFSGVLGVMYNPYTNVWYLMEGDASGTKVRIIRSTDI